MTDEKMRKEVMEAMQAGERALASLKTAKEKLQSARGWGIFDMLGGGLITDLIKHSKINEATGCLEDARYELQCFQKELSDVRAVYGLRIDIGGFLSFADFFFDGLIADYLVQTKINEAREDVDDAIRRVETILSQLRNSDCLMIGEEE